MAVAVRDELVSLIESDWRYRRMAERIEAQASLAAFCERMDPTYERARHSDLLIEHLEAVERGDIRRLMVFEPPRHSKTYHVSERFPAWMTGRQPRVQGILASYGAELAERNSRVVRNIIKDDRWPFPNVKVADDSSAVNRWATNHGGIWVAAGVGGAMTGFGADVLLIDDPVKGRAEADSETYRDGTWNWYAEVARTRLMPRGRIVVCQTRWHEDDLAGRLLNSRGAADWTVLNLPALAEQDDILGRKPGEPLWPDWYGLDALEEVRRDLTTEQGSRAWQALYQQRPTADEGGMFRRAWFQQRYHEQEPYTFRVLGVDAAFKTGVQNDYSALVLIGATAERFAVVDVQQGRWEYPDLKRQIIQAAEMHRPHAIVIEDTASGQSAIQELRLSTRLPIIPVKVTASKEARAQAVAPMCEAGRVVLPNVSTWSSDLVDELAAFPTGAHDDMVDAFVHAMTYAMRATAGGSGLVIHDLTMGSAMNERRNDSFQRMRLPAPARVR